jgi:hypothetical protein
MDVVYRVPTWGYIMQNSRRAVREQEWELSVGDCHGKSAAEEELEVSLWRLNVIRFSHSETVLILLPGND